jgi:Trypsin
MTPKNSSYKPQAPITPAQLVKWDNVINYKRPPEELRSLKSSNSLVIHKDIHDFKPESALRKIDIGVDVSAWNLMPGHDILLGLPGRTGARLSREELTQTKPPSGYLEAHRPEWADVIYHRKLSGGNFHKPMRRFNGRRVWPHGYVFGPDTRQPFYPSGYPNQCIGRIFVGSDGAFQESGTASLVGKNVIVTAGHMIPWGASSWMAKFVPAYYNGASTLGPNVYSYCEQYRGYNPGDSGKAHDIAVLKLYDPLGEMLGFFGCQTYDDNWNDGNYWTMVGYPLAVANAEQPSFQSGISFHDDDEDGDAMELETDNNASTPGDSGGPYYHWWSDGFPYIVGVDSGGEEEYQAPFTTQDNNIAAGGAALTNLIAWANSNW